VSAGTLARILAAVCCVTACRTPLRAHEARTIENASAHRVKIAVLAPTRGELAPIGTAIRTGAHVALDVARDDASAHPSRVQSIEILDVDAGDASENDVRRATEIVAGRTDIVAVIVGVPVGSSTLAVRALERTGAALITIGGVPVVGAFEVAPHRLGMAAAAGRFVGAVLRAKHPAALVAIGVGRRVELDAFVTSARRFTAAPIIESYPLAIGGGADPLRGLGKQGVDVVYMPGPLERTSPAVRLSAVHGLNARFVVEERWVASSAMPVVSPGITTYALATYALDDGEPITTDFVERYRRAGAGAPTEDAALAYDAVRLVYAALGAAKRPEDPAAVTRAVYTAVDVPSLSGPLRIDAAGNAVRTIVVRELGAAGVFARVTP
jgi:ABC-type branched-subunit amino acid transport system substrate-binding protein